ncbi:MAG: Hsp20/alpha crystallin family protein, partial [Verrucomicrobia bacterium]|nr:Hsp20/alpha crystallin family protein [Verrucomicrobiota bacterium]
MEQRMPQRWFSPRALMDELGDMNWLSNPSGLQISEDATHVLVEASLPGLTEGEIDITYEKGTLMVRGEKQETEDDKNKKFYRRSSRSFFYQMAVPENVDDSVEPKAEFKNGVAIISFSK